MTTFVEMLAGRFLLFSLAAPFPLAATTIDFEAQAAHRGAILPALPIRRFMPELPASPEASYSAVKLD
jgi:hypothetical protein